MCIGGQIIFFYDLLGYGQQFDSDILWIGHGCLWIKIGRIESYEARITSGDHTVDNSLD